MEEPKFALLLRKAAQQATRRDALGALVGGALLLGDRGEIEATRKAKRRKKHKHRALQNGPASLVFQVKNGTERTVSYSIGTKGVSPQCCRYVRDSIMDPSGTSIYTVTLFDANPWIWVDDGKYWFEFVNPWAYGPIAKIAINGRFPPSNNCCTGIPFGQRVHHQFELPSQEGRWRFIDIAGKEFGIQRNLNPFPEAWRITIHLPPNA